MFSKLYVLTMRTTQLTFVPYYIFVLVLAIAKVEIVEKPTCIWNNLELGLVNKIQLSLSNKGINNKHKR